MNSYGISDIGMKRTVNQDAFVIKEYSKSSLLCVVCDGMGGTLGGKEAAEIASSTFVSEFDKFMIPFTRTTQSLHAADIAHGLQRAVSSANKAVLAYADRHPELRGMGTTLIALFTIGRELFYANVGDSRFYLVGDKTIRRMTKDHSYIQYLLDTKQITEKEAAHAKGKNLITRAIGTEASVSADLYRHRLPDDGRYYALLCSDGLYNMVAEKVLLRTLTGSSVLRSENLESKAYKLIQTANKNGGSDNITAVLVKFS